MLDSVLRVFGSDFDVRAFLQAYSLSVQPEPYVKGEADLLGTPNSESGFDALISANESAEQNLNAIRALLENNQDAFKALKEVGASCIIDIGCTVGQNDQFTASVNLPVDLLGLCYQLNLSVEFSAYPAEVE